MNGGWKTEEGRREKKFIDVKSGFPSTVSPSPAFFILNYAFFIRGARLEARSAFSINSVQLTTISFGADGSFKTWAEDGKRRNRERENESKVYNFQAFLILHFLFAKRWEIPKL